MTHIQSRRNAAIVCMNKVMKLLAWDELTYCNYQYETGLAYISLIANHDIFHIDEISKRKVFWNWWKVHWTLREESLFHDLDPKYSTKTMRLIYHTLHDPDELAKGKYRYCKDLENSYAVMIKDLHHEQH